MSSLVRISPNESLARLVADGLTVQIQSDHLLIHDLPYLDCGGLLKTAILASTLNHSTGNLLVPDTHVVYFSGDFPCEQSGQEIPGLRHGDGFAQPIPGYTFRYTFSHKPQEGYPDYHAKITRYVQLICRPAMAKYPEATPYLRKPPVEDFGSDVLRYSDTGSSKYGVLVAQQKFREQRIGIVGLGGTGSYVLDLLAKTPVQALRLIDDDVFRQHNAFRAPGAAALADLRAEPKKVAWFSERYGNMHSSIGTVLARITNDNLAVLDGLTFAFVCVDDGPGRAVIAGALYQRGIPFIDVGIDLQQNERYEIFGACRVTLVTTGDEATLASLPTAPMTPDDLYRSQIQTADLNCLNAALAVARWKRHLGFYSDRNTEVLQTFTVQNGHLEHRFREEL